MLLARTEKPLQDHVLIAPEGFVEEQILPAIEIEQVPVIEVRYLADVPVIQYRSPMVLNH